MPAAAHADRGRLTRPPARAPTLPCEGSDDVMFRSPAVWLSIVLVVFAALLPDGVLAFTMRSECPFDWQARRSRAPPPPAP